MRTLFCEGIEPVGNVVMKKAMFTVETISAGMGEVLVYVEDPAGHREEVWVLSLCITVFLLHGFVMFVCVCFPSRQK